MSLLSAILPVKAAVGAVNVLASALRPGPRADFSAALAEARGTDFIGKWDADKNGTISPDEFPGKTQVFAQWDRNGDGVLNAAEAHLALTKLSDASKQRAAADERWNLLDSNGDDVLALSESGMQPREFGAIDANADGEVSRAEWLRAHGLSND
jgi:hypothetical protein